MPISTPVKGLRLPQGSLTGIPVEDEVALEAPINIFINDKQFSTIFATPEDIHELAIGHLLGEGIVNSIVEIDRIDVDGTDCLVYVKDYADVKERIDAHSSIRLIYSSCGSVEDYLKALDGVARPRVKSNYSIDASSLVRMLSALGRGSGSLKKGVSVHSAAIFSQGELLATVDDVSRYATVDKAIGKAASAGADFSKTVLLTTGRQASDMVLKAARVSIPITVSLRGPLYSGIYSAMRCGITLVSVVRGRGITVYSYPERIKPKN